jgi:hypothetical protein
VISKPKSSCQLQRTFKHRAAKSRIEPTTVIEYLGQRLANAAGCERRFQFAASCFPGILIFDLSDALCLGETALTHSSAHITAAQPWFSSLKNPTSNDPAFE